MTSTDVTLIRNCLEVDWYDLLQKRVYLYFHKYLGCVFYNTLKNIKKTTHNFCYVGNRHDTYMYMVKIWCDAKLKDCTFRSRNTHCSIIFSLVRCVVHNAVYKDVSQH